MASEGGIIGGEGNWSGAERREREVRKRVLAEAGAARHAAVRYDTAQCDGGPQVLRGTNEVLLTRSL